MPTRRGADWTRGRSHSRPRSVDASLDSADSRSYAVVNGVSDRLQAVPPRRQFDVLPLPATAMYADEQSDSAAAVIFLPGTRRPGQMPATDMTTLKAFNDELELVKSSLMRAPVRHVTVGPKGWSRAYRRGVTGTDCLPRLLSTRLAADLCPVAQESREKGENYGLIKSTSE